MQFKFPHNTTKTEAINRIKKTLDESRSKINENATDVKEEWQGDVLHFGFTAQGQHIEGTLTTTDTDFEIYAKLPLALRLFEGTIQRMIEAEARKLIK